MRFLNLSSLFLALALLTAGTAAVAAWRGVLRRRRRLAMLVTPPLDAALAASVHAGRRRFRDVLLFLGLACLLAALALYCIWFPADIMHELVRACAVPVQWRG